MSVKSLQAVSGDAITKIRSGVVLKTLPDFSFYSENVEQNRVIANEELFKVATGSSVVAEQQPIKIDFSPTNQNLIRFTAKSSEDRSPANVNRSPVKNNIPTTTDSAVQACLGLVGATVTSVKSPLKKEMGTQAVVEMVHLDQRTTEHVEVSTCITSWGQKIRVSRLFMPQSYHVQLPTHIHFMTFKLVSLFSVRNMYTPSFEHLNKVGVRATMDSKLEEQRSIIKPLLLEGEKPCHSFQRLKKMFSKACISHSPFYSWVSQFKEGRIRVRDKPG